MSCHRLRLEYYATWFFFLLVLIYHEVDMGIYIPHVHREITVGKQSGILTLGIRGYCVKMPNNTKCTNDFLG